MSPATTATHAETNRTDDNRLCPTHKVEMVERDMRGATYEQKWCGKWLDCPQPGCTTSSLEQSDELKAQLAEQKASHDAYLAAPKFAVRVRPEDATSDFFYTDNGNLVPKKARATKYTREQAETVARRLRKDHGEQYVREIMPVANFSAAR